MSGILKRKLEEGPSPYLSLQGSEDDEVSCSDSGNSSDSLNHPVASGLLDCKITSPHRSCWQICVEGKGLKVLFFIINL